jgi:hypothetical protein
VLVVVDVVPRVTVAAVDVVQVVVVRHGLVPASLAVDVHVAGVRQVMAEQVDRAVVHVVLVDVMDVTVVEEVDVVGMRYGGMPAEAVVGVGVLLVREVGGVGHVSGAR